MGQRCVSWTISRQGRTAARRNLGHRAVITPLEGRERLLTVVSIELHWISPGHLEGFPGGLKVDPLNDGIGRLSEVLRSLWHAGPFVELGLPAIGMSIAREIGKTESVKVNVVFGRLIPIAGNPSSTKGPACQRDRSTSLSRPMPSFSGSTLSPPGNPSKWPGEIQ